MSFFGLENSTLEDEKRRFQQGGLRADEDIAVYNWGEEDYDGLGSALQEGGDELNDETFGSSGPVGKDFDFTAHTLSEVERPNQTFANIVEKPKVIAEPARSQARESIWENKSPFSVLPRSSTGGSIGRKAGLAHQATPSTSSNQRFPPTARESSPAIQQQRSPAPAVTGTVNYAATGVRTLQEIEAEMRAQTQQARALKAQQAQQQQAQILQLQEQQQRQQQQQQQQQQQAQLQMKPPRMRSQSPSPYVHYQTGGIRMQSPSIAFQQEQLEAQERLRAEQLQRQLRQQAIEEARRQELLYAQQERNLQGGHSQQPSVQEIQNYVQQLLIEEAARDRRGRQDTPHHVSIEDVQMHLRQQQALQVAQLQQQRASPSPRYIQQQQQQHHHHQQQPSFGSSQSLQNIQDMQLQQKLLAHFAQLEFAQANAGLGSGNSKSQEALTAEAMRKIEETEALDRKRRRKASKIASMSRYNDLMTQSDKDFITRIQVSQLVTSDPYTEDFYAQVYGSLLRSRMGISSQEERVLKFGSGEGVGLGLTQRGGNRRPNAMQRMEAQVERIVNNARQREKEKGLHAIHSLQGALGKTAGRSYKAAPRQLLQVDSNGAVDGPANAHAHGHISKDDAKENAAGAAKEAARRGREALGDSSSVVRRDPLTRREILAQIEKLYDSVLNIEQMRRDQGGSSEEEKPAGWDAVYDQQVQLLWDGLQIMVPLETSDPHPFISLLQPAKGKRLLPRVVRHLSSQQMLTVLTLLVACFSQLDVVIGAPILDSLEDSPERQAVDNQTQLFLSTVMQTIFPVIAKTSLRLISGLVGLLMERCELHKVIQSRAGLSLLTAFLSRVEVVKSDMMANTLDQAEIPTEEDLLSWQNVFQHLFYTLAPHLLSLFPSTRIPALKTQENPGLNPDLLDQPVWQFLATLSLQAGNEQQQIIVSTLREKILENILAVNKGWVANEEEQRIKITNVNILLHALGLDSSQINL